ncbi:LysE family translocator [Ectopseudomonas alcaliphila]|jgi:threonine efflux protein|uniref:LysE family translocator n=1 Tax=Ectopseudomonas alcaliphila TaxID=101564 RepID=UPI002784BDDE|nr:MULTISPECIES: LysE family translocator [Pseudomonas]MDP9942282.1 threonine/homoserine/homoserine lactone efflux protein [Pseudomonas sp. 3400]MDR7014340.1 threonine/homoserine/homoserine lactone efflux protein [Pseudomonas alcaliphila]
MFALFLLVAGTHFAALLSPGPDFFLLIRTALTKGRRQADGCACGIALANLLSMLLVLFVMALLPAEGSWLWRGLQVVGGLYFAWIGLQALASRRDLVLPQGDQLRLGGVWKGMRQGLLASSLNPKLPLFYAGLFGVLRESAMPAWGLGLAMLWMTLVVLFWDLALVRLLDQARWRSWLQRRVRWLDRGCGGLLLALGGWLLLGAL